jgi:hypothetical protein
LIAEFDEKYPDKPWMRKMGLDCLALAWVDGLPRHGSALAFLGLDILFDTACCISNNWATLVC